MSTQIPWNKGTGGCKRGHDPSLYVCLPSGVFVCLECKRENGAKYRLKNREHINLSNRLGRYNITLEEFKALWKKQNGTCAICGDRFQKKKYRIDHNHDTGEVRGILCTSCNSGLGLFNDSPEILLRAAEYLSNNAHNENDSG